MINDLTSWNRVVFGVLLTIYCFIKIVRDRVPKKLKNTESCFTDVDNKTSLSEFNILKMCILKFKQ